MKRTARRFWILDFRFWIILAGSLLAWSGHPAGAQAGSPQTPPQTAVQSSTHISVVSGIYHLELDGTTGTFTRDALGTEPEQRYTLTYIHTDPGPKGYSKYLAWFLARNDKGYALVWAYLNDSGPEFYCWLYRYPGNQLTTLRFVGDYRLAPPAEPTPPVPAALDLIAPARYNGPDFMYKNWTRRVGFLDSLPVQTAKAQIAASVQGTGNQGQGIATPATPAPFQPDKSLTGLRVVPLHEIHVAKGNGWSTDGWRELHALATDAKGDPYYLILYSNATRGYAVDLRRAQTYTADFGQKVVFTPNSAVFGSNEDQMGGPPDLRVPRYTMHEITLPSPQKYDNPYLEVSLTAEFTAPDGKTYQVPGFWDGDNNWRVRFAPTQSGEWQWRTLSTDSALDKQFGTFTCVSDDDTGRGFLTVNPGFAYRHHFAYADGTPFLPAFRHDPVHFFSAQTVAKTPAANGPRLAAQTAPGANNNPATFTAFQQRIDAAAAMGFNRFVGDYLLDSVQFPAHTQRNEGGAPFVGYDLDQLNPAYFQWMDKRIAYINQKGGVPDIGLGDLDSEPLRSLSDTQLRTLMRYLVARYSAFNVCWNLFTGAQPPTPNDPRLALVTDMALLTHRYDAAQHPLTTLMIFPNATRRPLLPRPGDTPSPNTGKTPPGGKIIITPGGEIKPGTGDRGQGTAAPMPDAQRLTPDAGQNPNLRRMTPDAIKNLKSKIQNLTKYAGLVDAPWLDVVTVNAPDLSLLPRQMAIDKPVVVADTAINPLKPETLLTKDERRYRLWETRMLGGYWLDNSGQSAETDNWAAWCAKFFKPTRFHRLEPHPDMIGAPEETRFDRRRRLRAEAAARARGETIAPPPNLADMLKHPVYLLADPAWEYVAYFERGGNITLDLLEATGKVKVTWFNPRTGAFGDPRLSTTEDADTPTVMGGTYQTFTAPDDNDWVLYLSRR